MAERFSYVAGLRGIILHARFTEVLRPYPRVVHPPPLSAEDEFPAITLHTVYGSPIESHDGLSDLVPAVMQVNCWSPSYDEASALRESLTENVLSVFSGDVPNTDLSLQATATEFRFQELYDAERELHQVILRCSCWWTRTT